MKDIFAHDDPFEIQFLKDNLSAIHELDMGNISRTYIAELALAVCSDPLLFSSRYGVPKPPLSRSMDKGVLPSCTQEECTHYRNLGKLLGYCLRSSEIKSGPCLNDGVYEAIYIMTRDQIKNSAADLDRSACISMAEAFLSFPMDPSLADDPFLPLKNSLALLKKNELIEADFENAWITGCDDFLTDGQIDFEKVQANSERFKNLLFCSIFNDKSLIAELEGTTLGSVISGIHSIAQGLGDEWKQNVDIIGGFSLRDKIQGSANHILITFNDREDGGEKAGWLEEWIEHEATTVERMAFLNYTTGGPYALSDKRIEIDFGVTRENLTEATPSAMWLIISDAFNGTKEEFITKLKAEIGLEMN